MMLSLRIWSGDQLGIIAVDHLCCLGWRTWVRRALLLGDILMTFLVEKDKVP